jgi:hypothetical protein
MGIYNPASRAGGGLSLHAEGRAMDHGVTMDSAGEALGWAVFNWCLANAEGIGLQELQFNRRIWTSRRAGEGVRFDTSPSAGLHRDHVHIGQCWRGARAETSWYQPRPAVVEEEPMKRALYGLQPISGRQPWARYDRASDSLIVFGGYAIDFQGTRSTPVPQFGVDVVTLNGPYAGHAPVDGVDYDRAARRVSVLMADGGVFDFTVRQ